MTGTDDSGMSVGELSRLVRDVLVRFEGLAARLETQFVRGDTFKLQVALLESAIKQLQDAIPLFADKQVVADKFTDVLSDVDRKASKGEVEALAKRVAELEDDKKWLTRIVATFIILGVLGAVFIVSKAGGGG